MIKSMFTSRIQETEICGVSENSSEESLHIFANSKNIVETTENFSDLLSKYENLALDLKNEIEIKNNLIKSQQESIKELTSALENTTESLKAAQALHAGTIHNHLSISDGNKKTGFFSNFFGKKKKSSNVK